MMTFEEFRENVERWQEERGIYEHSTPMAQTLKAVSEVGELADAVIKGDLDALVDAIGDVAVCLVGVARMSWLRVERVSAGHYDETLHSCACRVACSVGDLACCFYARFSEGVEESIEEVIESLDQCAVLAGTTLEACCEAAWNTIKDRKGRMVANGAFIKDAKE